MVGLANVGPALTSLPFPSAGAASRQVAVVLEVRVLRQAFDAGTTAGPRAAVDVANRLIGTTVILGPLHAASPAVVTGNDTRMADAARPARTVRAVMVSAVVITMSDQDP